MSGNNLPEHYWVSYTSNVSMLLRVQGGKFAGTATMGSYSSNEASVVEQYGATKMQEDNGRFEPMQFQERELDRAWVYPRTFDHAERVARKDLQRVLTDPKSALVQGAADAANEKKDDLMVAAFFADRKSGEKGATTISFDTSTYRISASVGASGATGLNVQKIREVIKQMELANVDFDKEEAFMAISPHQHADLLEQSEVINHQYKGLGMYAEGGVVRKLGPFTLIRSNLLELDGSNRRLPVWVKSGMHCGTWEDVTTRHHERPDIRGIPTQIYTTMSMDCTRVEEGKVWEVQAAES